ncbi:MAG: hypothetical protein ACK4OK_05970 [Thermoflexus sp.]
MPTALERYRHRTPVVLATEPEPRSERLRWWEAAASSIAETGAALVVRTPEPVTLHGVVNVAGLGLGSPGTKSPGVWILDAYLEPRARLDASSLDLALLHQVITWVEGIQHECPE